MAKTGGKRERTSPNSWSRMGIELETKLKLI